MRFSLLLLFVTFGFCVSCIDNTSNNSENEANYSDSTEFNADSLSFKLWEYDASRDTLILPQSVSPRSAEEVIDLLNERYADIILLDLKKISGDTVFVKVEDAQYLTQQMGSTGAYGYMAEVTYSLTEVPGIDYVHFDFEEGDHATPGLYRRKDFLNKL